MDVTISTGRVRGFRAGPEVVAHLGIPFADPPFGLHRFAASQPVTVWTRFATTGHPGFDGGAELA
ncbi:carboxylesterase family protein [Umezawaea sp.]|uniref:carboxylesterase family protein n=1 Tax=Umezawaea sp. TaxID=1955258 RepID=UPI002ED1E081